MQQGNREAIRLLVQVHDANGLPPQAFTRQLLVKGLGAPKDEAAF
jgi:hypothetical protein